MSVARGAISSVSDFKKLQVWQKAHALSLNVDRAYVGIALSSSSEVEHHLLVMRDLHIIAKSTFDALSAQTITVRKMLYGLRRTLSDSTPV